MSKLFIAVSDRVCVIKHSRSLLSDHEVVGLVSYYEERPFSKLPFPVKLALRTRGIRFPAREPTEDERREAEADALEHRRFTFTETLDDLVNFYKRTTP